VSPEATRARILAAVGTCEGALGDLRSLVRELEAEGYVDDDVDALGLVVGDIKCAIAALLGEAGGFGRGSGSAPNGELPALRAAASRLEATA
jgi:hypothetical protein